MKQKDVKFIKEKFQIDITNYNKIEQKKYFINNRKLHIKRNRIE